MVGANFQEENNMALKNTMVLILVLDPSFNNSVQVLDEIDRI
jgi:hypothetical protein